MNFAEVGFKDAFLAEVMDFDPSTNDNGRRRSFWRSVSIQISHNIFLNT